MLKTAIADNLGQLLMGEQLDLGKKKTKSENPA